VLSDAKGVRAEPRGQDAGHQTVCAVVPDQLAKRGSSRGIRDITDSSAAAGRLSKAHAQAGRTPTRDSSTCHWPLRTLPRARTPNWRRRGFSSESSTARRAERMVLVPRVYGRKRSKRCRCADGASHSALTAGNGGLNAESFGAKRSSPASNAGGVQHVERFRLASIVARVGLLSEQSRGI
jgi:hypothetical protein